MKLQTFTLLITIFLTQLCFGQEIKSNIFNDFINNPEYNNAGIGLLVVDLNSEEIIFENNSHISMVPGSIQKLVTAGAALEILGEDYRFRTKLAYSGEIDSTSGILLGDLVIIGGGDPVLGSNYFKNYYFNPHFMDTWCDSILAKGITRIEGNIIIDCSIYEEQTVPDTWIWEDIGNYYGAGANALSIYDNTMHIVFKSEAVSGKPTQILQISPELDKSMIVNNVVSSINNRDLAYVYGAPWNGKRIIRGTIPKNRNRFTIKAALPEPGMVLGNDLAKKLAQNGVDVNGVVLKESSSINELITIISQKSPDLKQIIKAMNHESINLIAEHLVKQIAYEGTGFGSTKVGVKLVKKFWANKGIDISGMFLEDGSGLSHFNAITPNQMVDVLLYMRIESVYAEAFVNSLPSPGEGTLYVFDSANFPKNSIKCKSGSMTRVRCYAGYIHAKSGKEMAFVFMVNNFEGNHSKIISTIEELLIELRELY